MECKSWVGGRWWVTVIVEGQFHLFARFIIINAISSSWTKPTKFEDIDVDVEGYVVELT